MRLRPLILSLTALSLPVLGLACAPAEDEAASEAAMQELDLDAPACWWRDDPSPAELAERPSPPGEATVRLGGDEMKICYSRPAARDRQVMGGLVPYGQEWRTGANEATSVHLTFPAVIGDLQVEPGSYSLVTVPGEEEWEIILNSEWQRWGIGIPADMHVGRTTVPVEETEEMTEDFTIRLERRSDTEAHMILEWENTRVRVPVERTD